MKQERMRLATPADAEQILAIYTPYITDTTITFEYTVPSVSEFRQRIEAITATYPYVVYEVDQQIVGYAYVTKQRDRTAYQWNVELSVYFDQQFHGQGRGHKLCQAVLALATLQNIHNVYSLVTVPNPSSEKLHAKLGFSPLCVFEKTGYKFTDWHDVAWFQKHLIAHTQAPPAFLPIGDVAEQQLAQVLQAGILGVGSHI